METAAAEWQSPSKLIWLFRNAAILYIPSAFLLRPWRFQHHFAKFGQNVEIDEPATPAIFAIPGSRGKFPMGETTGPFSIATEFADMYPNPRWHYSATFGLDACKVLPRLAVPALRFGTICRARRLLIASHITLPSERSLGRTRGNLLHAYFEVKSLV